MSDHQDVRQFLGIHDQKSKPGESEMGEQGRTMRRIETGSVSHAAQQLFGIGGSEPVRTGADRATNLRLMEISRQRR